MHVANLSKVMSFLWSAWVERTFLSSETEPEVVEKSPVAFLLFFWYDFFGSAAGDELPLSCLKPVLKNLLWLIFSLCSPVLTTRLFPSTFLSSVSPSVGHRSAHPPFSHHSPFTRTAPPTNPHLRILYSFYSPPIIFIYATRQSLSPPLVLRIHFGTCSEQEVHILMEPAEYFCHFLFVCQTIWLNYTLGGHKYTKGPADKESELISLSRTALSNIITHEQSSWTTQWWIIFANVCKHESLFFSISLPLEKGM